MQEKKTPAARPAESPAAKLPHHLIVEDRGVLTATGVTRVVSCDETGATLETQQGTLLVGGEGLSVSELSVQSGQVRIAGSIEYIQYSQKQEKKAGLWARLLR